MAEMKFEEALKKLEKIVGDLEDGNLSLDDSLEKYAEGIRLSKMCQKMGINPVFVNGLRATDSQTLEIAQMVLVGKINKELVSQLNQEGGTAVGLSGHDSNLILAKQALPSLGFVGEIEQVNPEILTTLIQAGFIPVIAPIGVGAKGETYNINADTVAGAIASAIEAKKLENPVQWGE